MTLFSCLVFIIKVILCFVGKEDDDDTWKAKQVKLEDVTDVTTGDSHTAFLTKTNQVYLTGTMRDASGAFGHDRESGPGMFFQPFLFVSSRSKDLGAVKDRAVKISSGNPITASPTE